MSVAPLVQPERFGLPCWPGGAVEATIRPIAQVDYESRHRFLACHAPIAQIRDDRAGNFKTDAEIFEQISRLHERERENMVIVWGEPGTGKSHLINWLKLRFDYARASGEMTNVLPVLIQRRTGSLRDALEQLVSQLPERFGKYLDPVRSAIERISEAAARQELANAMHLELGVLWQERGKPMLPRHIRELPGAFHSSGFAGWLCRSGGVIDRNIQRLISPSEISERESIPEFTADEFLVQDLQFSSKAVNEPKVALLIDTLRDEPELAEEAARVCNSVLRDAIRKVTGLGNAQLSQIFRAVRGDLQQDKVKLVLFIEDVSTLSVLDDEVINAIEPQNDRSLCPLTAVVGMTDVAFKRLRDNQTERGSLILSVGGSTDTHWRSDGDALDRFTARYLNAVRLGEADLQALAEVRQDGSDVSRSACAGCHRRSECHAAFGSVDFDGVPVGLFPFVPGATARLLEALDERATGVRRTQRGLLEHLVKPVLQHVEGVGAGRRSPLLLAVARKEPHYWLTFRETHAGGWSDADLARLRVLAEFWMQARDADEAADRLGPLLTPLSFPVLRKQDTLRARPALQVLAPSPPPKPTPLPSSRPTVDPRLAGLLSRLDLWLGGSDLSKPRDAQELIKSFLDEALPLENFRISPAILQALKNTNLSAICIEGGDTSPANKNIPKIHIRRDTETRDFIAALARHVYEGNKSWEFEQGQRYKRVVARWLRANAGRIIAGLSPQGLDEHAPIRLAASFLALASTIRRRAGLPSETASALATVLAPASAETPNCLSPGLRRLYEDLPERQRVVREFLLNELDIPQGTGACVMIDPVLVLDMVTKDRFPGSVEALAPGYLTDFWKSRYAQLAPLSKWVDLPELLEKEQEALGAVVLEIKASLRSHDYPTTDVAQSVQAFIDDLLEVLRAQDDTNQPVPDAEFEKVKDKLKKRAAVYATAASDAERVATSEEVQAVLLFKPDDLVEARQVLALCAAYAVKVRAYTNKKRDFVTGEGDPDEAMERLRAAVDRISLVQQSASGLGANDVVA
jgi:hypothetical protein